ncbi:unnamed protein product, partial [Brassica rapa]
NRDVPRLLHSTRGLFSYRGGGAGDKRSTPTCISSLLQTNLALIRFTRAYHSHQFASPTDRALRYSIGSRFD